MLRENDLLLLASRPMRLVSLCCILLLSRCSPSRCGTFFSKCTSFLAKCVTFPVRVTRLITLLTLLIVPLKKVIKRASRWTAIPSPFGTLDSLCFTLVCYFHIVPLNTWDCSGFNSVSLFEQNSTLKVPSMLCLKPMPLAGSRRPSLLKVWYTSRDVLG